MADEVRSPIEAGSVADEFVPEVSSKCNEKRGHDRREYLPIVPCQEGEAKNIIANSA